MKTRRSLVPPMLSRVLSAKTSSLHATLDMGHWSPGRHLKLANFWHFRGNLLCLP